MKAGGLEEVAVNMLLDNFSSVLEVSESSVRIYHKSFGDWLAETGYRDGRRRVVADLKSGHDLMFKLCVGLWADGGEVRESSADDILYSVLYGLEHGVGAGMEPEVELEVDLGAGMVVGAELRNLPLDPPKSALPVQVVLLGPSSH